MTGEDNNENTSAVESEARLLGWVPKEEFRDGDHWVDAESFVKRGKEINPILRKNNETLLKKLEEANREITEVKKVAKEFEKFQKENTDRKIQELSDQLVALKEQKREAITQGDGETVVAIDDAIDAIKAEQAEAKQVKEVPKTVEKPAATLDPLVTEWMDTNTWFTTDTKYTKIADAIGEGINQEFPHLRGKDFFNKLDEELERVLPDKYLKKTRSSPVEGNSNQGRNQGSGKKHSYENLPADAKVACDRFVKQGFMTKEAYVAEYDWS